MSPATAVFNIFLNRLLVTGVNILTCLLSAYILVDGYREFQ